MAEEFKTGRTFELGPDPLARLPALAARLGVEETPDAFGLNLRTRDGRTYSVFDLIEAMLDCLDVAAKKDG